MRVGTCAVVFLQGVRSLDGELTYIIHGIEQITTRVTSFSFFIYIYIELTSVIILVIIERSLSVFSRGSNSAMISVIVFPL